MKNSNPSQNKENDFVFYPGKNIYRNIFNSKSLVVGGQPKQDFDLAVNLSKYLGAVVKENISTKVDYLFTTNLRSKKFCDATKFDIPVIKRKLIFDLWKNRNIPDVKLCKDIIAKNRYLPFEQMKMKFLGFDKDQVFQLEEELINNGGAVSIGDQSPDQNQRFILVPNDYPRPENITVDELDNVVMEEWFWSCIQVKYKKNAILNIFENIFI